MDRGQAVSRVKGELEDVTVGVPRALTYHLHPVLWETFFRELGAKVRVSEPTTEETVERASLISESEHCLSVKLFDAHVQELVGDVDIVFVPRILSTSPDHIACPKLGAVPDSVRADFGDRVDILTLEIDGRKEGLRSALERLGGKVEADTSTTRSATMSALRAMQQAREEAIIRQPGSAERCLLLSHPYNLQDPYLMNPVVEKLSMMDVGVHSVDFSEDPNPEGRIKWDTSAIMRDALKQLDPGQYDAVIQITAFNCGCDSMISDFYEEILRDRGVPYMSLVMDEHTATAGIDTRLEAFIDSIRARRQERENSI